MTKLALVLALLLPLPALAQTAAQTDAAATSSAPPADLPIAAMRHQQPDRSDVTQREIDRFGATHVEHEQISDQTEVDQLYREVMQRSAPAEEPKTGQ